jgi:RNA polymerase primary sigma factor
MDAPAGDLNHSTLGSLVPDPSSPDIEHEAGLDELKDLVQQALRHLPERLRSIVTMRFGLDGNPPLTLVEVGQRLSLTRERIRQLQAKAFLSLYKLSRREERFAALSRYLPSAS